MSSFRSTLKAWLDNVILMGRTAGESPSAKGTPVTVAASRGGSYAPGTPREPYEYVQNYLKAVLGDAMDLSVDFIVPALTTAPHVPVMAELVPLLEASRDRALAEAAAKAKQLAERLPARAAGDHPVADGVERGEPAEPNRAMPAQAQARMPGGCRPTAMWSGEDARAVRPVRWPTAGWARTPWTTVRPGTAGRVLSRWLTGWDDFRAGRERAALWKSPAGTIL